MIEVIYKEEKQETKGSEALFCIPRNIRQIGPAEENYRIYMEDYVYTFLGKLAETSAPNDGSIALLTGEVRWQAKITYLFVQGAVMAEGMEAAPDHVDFTEDVWTMLQKEKEHYFPEQEIVGWFFARPQLALEITDILFRAHRKHFGGEKVLMLMDPAEKEDAFFRCESDHMIRQSGYYIYYEKNPLMQAYMQERFPAVPGHGEEEAPDKAVKTFRKIIQGKQKAQKEETEGRTSVFSYAATACLAIAALTVGLNFYQNLGRTPEGGAQTETVSSASAEQETSEPTATPAPTLAAVRATATPAPEKNRKEEVSETGAGTRTAENYPEESDARKARRHAAPTVTEAPGEQETPETQEEKTASQAVRESYVIRPGDTLYEISMARYGDMSAIEEICRLNGFSEDEVIYPGQIIVLP